MPLTLLPPALSREDALSRRLASLSARVRRTIILRATAWLVILGIIYLFALALLDHRFALPGLVRALGLVAIVAAVPLLVRRWILGPLNGTADPVRIARRVENAYPEFNDSLVSAVQFLRQSGDDRSSSPTLRKRAIARATRKAERYDFDRAVDSRYFRRSLLAAAALMVATAWVGLARPEAAKAAALRIAVPFGGQAAVTQTRMELLAPQPTPHRMARGEPLDVRVALTGLIPDRVQLSVKLDGNAAIDQVYSVPVAEGNRSEVTLRIEPTRIPRDFQFRVRANDSDTGWQTVHVLPPPLLVPLDGRPSPQLHLAFPAYTDLAPIDLPDGSGVIECVAGTRVTLRAATDRAVARAWIAYRPEQPRVLLASMLAPLGATQSIDVPAFGLLGREVWAEVPVSIHNEGTLLTATFVPRMPGPYAFRFEDETGLGTTRMLDVRVAPDPAPLVTLDRPAANRDSLLLLPDAEVTVAARVADKQFAIRSVRLEYRTNRGSATRSIPWYEGDVTGRALPAAAAMMTTHIPLQAIDPLRLRPQQLTFENRLSLTRFTHADGSPLQVGDVLTLLVAADDFDDVTGFKAPGRSHEVELRIVAKADLEAAEQQNQAELRAEILRLQTMQREARARVQEAIQQAKNTGKLRPEDLDRLGQAEQLQQQIRSRLNNPEDGLRAQLNKQKQSAADNHMPRSAATDRLDAAAAELGRLANEVLDPLEADLAQSRKPLDGKDPPTNSLGRAEKRQRDVEQTFKSLLERLEPWSGAGEIRGEARSVLNETKRQAERNDQLGDKVPAEKTPDQLPPEQKAELDRGAVGDDRVSERVRQVIEKMNRLAVEKDAAIRDKSAQANQKDAEANQKRAAAAAAPSGSEEQKRLSREANDAAADARAMRESAEDMGREADALRQAATAGNAEQMKERMRKAGDLTRQNQPRQAAAEQRAAAADLERMLAALEEQKEQEADRMQKRRKDAEKDLTDILDKQEMLQKKGAEAQAIADPEKRKAELDKLSREQEKLEAEAKELAQRLSRNRSDEAAQELRRAAREMERAREQMENGDNPDAAMENALDRLDNAEQELKHDQQKQDEELIREKQAKIADDIKAIRDREQRLLEESARIHGVIKTDKKWERPLLTSLNDLRQQQEALAGELRGVIGKKFEAAAVFERMLRQSADAMELASKRIGNRLDAAEVGPFDLELEDIADLGIRSQQRLALKRMDQLIEALKPDKPGAGQAQAGGGPQGPPMGNGGAEGGNQLPPLAQLKALRALQADIGERTAAFDKAHPDRTKLNDDETAELESLQKMQLDVAELVKELTEKNPTP